MGKFKEETIKGRTMIIDGDMLLYRVGFACEVETNWGNDLWTLHTNLSEMKVEVISFIEKTKQRLSAEDAKIIFSPKRNFRYNLFPAYKANRKGKRKPMGMKPLRAWMDLEFDTETAENMEADDLIGIMCTYNPDDYIAVSGDKDFGTLPITWYDYLKDKLVFTTPEYADYFHYVQCLAGDTADGYPGVKGIGTKTAMKLLDKNGANWKTVVDAYKKADMTEDDALLTARLAHILQQHNYNKATKEIILWNPPTVH